MKFLPTPLNVNYTVLQRRVRTKVFCQIREETKQIFWSISEGCHCFITRPQNGGRVYLTGFNSFKMLGESNFLWEKPGCILKHPLGSWHLICSPCPDDDKLFIAKPRHAPLVTPIHPPIVPTECRGRQNRVLFCLSTGKKGGLLELGREWGVLWRRNAIHIMSGTLRFQRSRNACKPQTSGKMWTPGTWQLTPINSEIRAGKSGIRNPTHNLSGTFQRSRNAKQIHPKLSKWEKQQ